MSTPGFGNKTRSDQEQRSVMSGPSYQSLLPGDSAMRQALVVLAVCAFVFGAFASAQVPQKISYQGILQTSLGTPVQDGSYDLRFDLSVLHFRSLDLHLSTCAEHARMTVSMNAGRYRFPPHRCRFCHTSANDQRILCFLRKLNTAIWARNWSAWGQCSQPCPPWRIVTN